MTSTTVKTFPLYSWDFIPETAGISNPSELISAIACKRNLLDAKSEYHSPFLMGGMQSAVERISRALKNNEKILIHGDYDVDGIVAAVILHRFLKSVGANPQIYLPTRRGQGYGLALDAVEKAANNGISLIITVDCGIADWRNVEYGNEKGIDFIITDHHQVPDKLPDAVAVVHGAIEGEGYPYPSLSGAAVSFKLIQALSEYLKKPIDLQEYHPYVGLSIITDIMPLTGENRLFVRDGIKAIHKGFAPHIEILARAGGFNLSQIGARELGFHVGSRLNAPGRLDSPVLSAKFLMEDDKSKIAKIAASIERINSERREIQEDVARKAVKQANRERDYLVHVLRDPDWHEGLLGTAASRVVDETGHPAILFTKGLNGLWKGSGRSPEGINLYSLLCNSKEIMEHFGGHPTACGVSLADDKFDDLKKQVVECAKDKYPTGYPRKTLEVVSKLSTSDIDMKFVENMKVLEPFGMGNREPLFEFGPIAIENANFVGGGNHLKLAFKSGNKKHSGIMFKVNGVRIGDIIGRVVSMVATPIINEFMGNRKLEYQVRDIKPVE